MKARGYAERWVVLPAPALRWATWAVRSHSQQSSVRKAPGLRRSRNAMLDDVVAVGGIVKVGVLQGDDLHPGVEQSGGGISLRHELLRRRKTCGVRCTLHATPWRVARPAHSCQTERACHRQYMTTGAPDRLG